jgi:hypothetical protein
VRGTDTKKRLSWRDKNEGDEGVVQFFLLSLDSLLGVLEHYEGESKKNGGKKEKVTCKEDGGLRAR